MADHDAEAERDWRYFAEALGWYPTPGVITGSQVFGVVQAVQQALRDERITPADLGIVPEYQPARRRLQDVSDQALLLELRRRLALRPSS